MATPEIMEKCRIIIVPADNPARIEAVRELFKEYAASLSFNLCFQSFDAELAGLPGDYAPLTGVLLLGLVEDRPAGCVALRRIEDDTPGEATDLLSGSDVCEMKRLYVRPQFRGCGLGRELVNSILRCAAAIGYRRMRLDTVPTEMATAVDMYRKLGFREIPPYRKNPVPGAKYMELNVQQWISRFPKALDRKLPLQDGGNLTCH